MMNKKTRAKAVRARPHRKASAAGGYPWANGVANGWRWIVDDRMRDYGEINYSRRVIRINRAMHKREGELLIDTLFHEELHRMFPALGERAICGMTRLLLPTLSRRYRKWLYSRIRSR
jgi:hypothetical protein